MTLRLYSIPLQDAASSTVEDEIAADIQQAGFVGQGGTAAEKVSAESIDLTITGQFRFGDTLSRKFAAELDSLAAGGYEAVPLYDSERDAADRKRRYYHVEEATSRPAHQTTDADYEYTVALSEAGSRRDSWRAVRTNPQGSGTDLASGADALVGLDSQATKARWFAPSSGTDIASGTDATPGADGAGATRQYDPDEPGFTNPILLYQLPFDAEHETDVVCYDDRRVSRTAEFAAREGFQYDTAQYDSGQRAGAAYAVQWHRVFHTAYEFDGRPVVDTGLLRVRFDEGAGELVAWQASDGVYAETALDQSDYDLFDADVIEIGPADVRVHAEFEKTDGTIDAAELSFQRGSDEVLVLGASGASNVADDVEDLLRPIALDWDEDPAPAQDLVRRSEVR